MADPAPPLREGLYQTIRLIRRFEERSIDLVKSGHIGSGIHPCIGQEGVAAGVCAALTPDDVVLSNHRGHGHLLAKGCEPGRVLAEMMGRDTGIARGRGGSFHPSDFSHNVFGATGTVGHGAAIAAGVAWAAKQTGAGRVVVSFFGEGAVNQGALLEGLNLAGLWQLPVIFVCENNLYATTLPVAAAVAGTITGRAEAFGIPAATVDGQDAEVVYDAASQALARARSGGGPTLLEMSTYRYHGHHTFELKTRLRYRDPDEVASWLARDPLELQATRVPAGTRERVDAAVETRLDDAVRFALDSPRPDPIDALANLYSTGLRVRAGVAD
jgi:pyruvate dehydrogenase E1 component alpha subunit